MNFNDLINKVCGELPEWYQIIIECENGYGGVALRMPNGDIIDGCLDDTTIDEQVLELLKYAKQNYDVNDA